MFILISCIVLLVWSGELMAKSNESYALKEGVADAKRLDSQHAIVSSFLYNALNTLSSKVELEGAYIVDFGCGTSSAYEGILQFIGSSGTYIGIDASEKPIEYSKSRYPHLTYICGDHNDKLVQEELAQADIVFLRFVVMHQKNSKSFIRKIFSHIKKGAIIIVQDSINTPAQKKEMEEKYGDLSILCDFKVVLSDRLGLDYNFSGRLEEAFVGTPLTYFSHTNEPLIVPNALAKDLYQSFLANIKSKALEKVFSKDELRRYQEAILGIPEGREDYWFVDEIHTYFIQK